MSMNDRAESKSLDQHQANSSRKKETRRRRKNISSAIYSSQNEKKKKKNKIMLSVQGYSIVIIIIKKKKKKQVILRHPRGNKEDNMLDRTHPKQKFKCEAMKKRRNSKNVFLSSFPTCSIEQLSLILDFGVVDKSVFRYHFFLSYLLPVFFFYLLSLFLVRVRLNRD